MTVQRFDQFFSKSRFKAKKCFALCLPCVTLCARPISLLLILSLYSTLKEMDSIACGQVTRHDLVFNDELLGPSYHLLNTASMDQRNDSFERVFYC